MRWPGRRSRPTSIVGVSSLEHLGMAADAVNQAIDYLITSQAVMLATNQLMTVIGVAFLIAASVIWLAPRPKRVVEPGAGGTNGKNARPA